eukprot:6490767-Amphidinium_carterae.1
MSVRAALVYPETLCTIALPAQEKSCVLSAQNLNLVAELALASQTRLERNQIPVMDASGLSLESSKKDVPPGWRPGLHRYPFSRYLERVRLWVCTTDMRAGQQGPALASRLEGRPKDIALSLRVVNRQGNALTGAEALAFEGAVAIPAAADGAAAQPAIPSGGQQLLRELERVYGADTQQQQTVTIDQFLDLRRGRDHLYSEARRLSERIARQQLPPQRPPTLAEQHYVETWDDTTVWYHMDEADEWHDEWYDLHEHYDEMDENQEQPEDSEQPDQHEWSPEECEQYFYKGKKGKGKGKFRPYGKGKNKYRFTSRPSSSSTGTPSTMLAHGKGKAKGKGAYRGCSHCGSPNHASHSCPWNPQKGESPSKNGKGDRKGKKVHWAEDWSDEWQQESAFVGANLATAVTTSKKCSTFLAGVLNANDESQPTYHVVRGKIMFGLLWDPGAASNLAGTNTILEYLRHVVWPAGGSMETLTHRAQSFTGIDGQSSPSGAKVSLPIRLGALESAFVTDTIGGSGDNCPMLLSNRTAIAKRLISIHGHFDNGDGLLIVPPTDSQPCQGIRMLLTDSGHYLIPLCSLAESDPCQELHDCKNIYENVQRLRQNMKKRDDNECFFSCVSKEAMNLRQATDMRRAAPVSKEFVSQSMETLVPPPTSSLLPICQACGKEENDLSLVVCPECDSVVCRECLQHLGCVICTELDPRDDDKHTNHASEAVEIPAVHTSSIDDAKVVPKIVKESVPVVLHTDGLDVFDNDLLRMLPHLPKKMRAIPEEFYAKTGFSVVQPRHACSVLQSESPSWDFWEIFSGSA